MNRDRIFGFSCSTTSILHRRTVNTVHIKAGKYILGDKKTLYTRLSFSSDNTFFFVRNLVNMNNARIIFRTKGFLFFIYSLNA